MELLERSATDLARGIREGELTSREVVGAHIEHARRINHTVLPAHSRLTADGVRGAHAPAPVRSSVHAPVMRATDA